MAQVRNAPAGIQGRVVQNSDTSMSTIPASGARGNAKWWYMYHPFKWTFRGGHFIPKLGRFILKPGLNNIDPKGNTNLAEVEMMTRGWTLLKQGDQRLGKHANYLQEFTNSKGHLVYKSIWETPRVVAGQTFWTMDQEGFDATVAGWVKHGVISQIDQEIARGMINKKVSRLSNIDLQLMSKPDNGFFQLRQSKQKALIKAMEEDYDRLFNPKPAKETK